VVISGRRAKAGEQLADELGPRVLFLTADVTVAADVAAIVDAGLTAGPPTSVLADARAAVAKALMAIASAGP